MIERNYINYCVTVPNDSRYYGGVTSERAEVIAADVARLIEREFPGIEIIIQDSNFTGKSGVSGPDNETFEEISNWIRSNWTSAL